MPRVCVAIFAFVGITHAPTSDPQIDGTRQVVGLVASSCIQFTRKRLAEDQSSALTHTGSRALFPAENWFADSLSLG
jgi:hypothetical protein